MLKAIRHRGPDATAVWSEKGIHLGHNRLSIIDHNPCSNQPMTSGCGRYVIVFNGEIYNYKELRSLAPNYPFRTRSDTEVLIALYAQMGPAMLDELNGMYAFVIWDRLLQVAFGARDRFGVKPLFFSENRYGLVVASEIKAIWAAGIARERDLPVWSDYLTSGGMGRRDGTFWKNISQVPAGHCFSYSQDNGMKTWRHYDFVSRVLALQEKAAPHFHENYLELLGDAVKLRFRADVPVGFNLSGGLDSSLLLAMVGRNAPKDSGAIEAFTFYCADDRYDELPWVREMLKSEPHPLNEVLLKADDVPYLAGEIATQADEPYGGMPTIAYSGIFKRAREKGILVLLDGQGMDESWAGYDYYANGSNSTVQGAPSACRPEVLKDEFVQIAQRETIPKPFASHLLNLQYRDLFYTKIPRALRFNDRISMMHGTELREPFLDYRIVEMGLSRPDHMKIRDGVGKWFLRQLALELIGPKLALAPKRPLQTPQREWTGTILRPWAEERIAEFAKFDFVNPRQLAETWQSYLQGKQESSFHIWQWINLSYLKD